MEEVMVERIGIRLIWKSMVERSRAARIVDLPELTRYSLSQSQLHLLFVRSNFSSQSHLDINSWGKYRKALSDKSSFFSGGHTVSVELLSYDNFVY